jgi:hypothetical protein
MKRLHLTTGIINGGKMNAWNRQACEASRNKNNKNNNECNRDSREVRKKKQGASDPCGIYLFLRAIQIIFYFGGDFFFFCGVCIETKTVGIGLPNT